ncbi:MAG: glycosyltransferase [Bacteroidaceae bacterium]|nr:glycosyltransferase [Bacteroidaceae bacterium]
MIRLSVIIPVYKVEETLDKCVESVLSQDIMDMEVIMVDDGSPDACPQLCDKWAAKDSRIKVIHKLNGGLSDARNAGIDKATGHYLTFVDSDDYLEKNTYSPLLAVLDRHPEYDILEYPIFQYEGDKAKESLLSFQDQLFTDIHSYWYSTLAYHHTYACNKIYKRNLFENIRFPKGKVFEDVLTYPRILEVAHNVATSAQGLYHYCLNPNGITSLADGEKWRFLLEAHLNIISNPLFLPVSEEYCLQLLNIQLYTSELTGDPPRIPHIRFHRILNTKTLLNNLLGINIFCKLNRCFRKIVKRR